jgi:hypothetical protein
MQETSDLRMSQIILSRVLVTFALFLCPFSLGLKGQAYARLILILWQIIISPLHKYIKKTALVFS